MRPTTFLAASLVISMTGGCYEGYRVQQRTTYVVEAPVGLAYAMPVPVEVPKPEPAVAMPAPSVPEVADADPVPPPAVRIHHTISLGFSYDWWPRRGPGYAGGGACCCAQPAYRQAPMAGRQEWWGRR
jgi:hypothetical protein